MGISDPYGEGLKIMAMGDVDNDKHIDLITLNSDHDSFTVHYYNGESMSFTAGPVV